ncbi:cupin domain-containing protein [Roseomonas sp. BN140053]|uniref:cupin domain-containing protein n=1 Tax=Roseomonas sp. BN140053 TaxID=3391898 RepID=UPI0039E9A5C8
MDAEKLKLAAESIEATPFDIPGAEGQFRIQILNEGQNRGVVTTIVHLPAGGKIPAHFHKAGAEMHYVLEGDLIEAGETLGAGAFLTHAAGVVHGPHESRGGAKVLTVQQWQSQNGAFDFNLAESQAGTAASGDGDPQEGGGPSAGAQAGTAQPGAAQSGDAPPTTSGVADDSDVARERENAKGYT